MTAGSPAGVRPVRTFSRAVFVAAAVLAAIAGVQLYVLTDRTDHFFAWTIAQPLSATFLGTGYWTGTVLLLFAAREQAWANVRVALAAVVAFVPLMLVTTLLHLDRFHTGSSDLNAWIAAWAWLIVYAVVPFAVVAVLIVQLRTPGGDPPLGASLSRSFQALIGLNAAVSLFLAVALFLAPDTMTTVWPWQLTPLTSQAIGTGFAAVTAASFQFLRENSIGRARGGTLSYLAIGALQLFALARYADTVEWSRPATWLYVGFMAGILVGGLYGVAAWLPIARRSPVAPSGGA